MIVLLFAVHIIHLKETNIRITNFLDILEHCMHRTEVDDLPFCSISRCSQRMSPMKAGALARKVSLPMERMSLPLM